MLYHFLKVLLHLGIKLYYKEIKVTNKSRLKGEGPRIIIANHPNTLMDAWLIGSVCKGKIHYMTKGTFFNSPFKRWFLMSLGLIPINRRDDNMTQGVSNSDSFEKCYELLERGKTLVIFPEGNSFAEKLLRKLKSGTARIALETERRNEGKLGLTIIPVGLIYLRPEKFRSSVMVNVGEAIDPLPYLEGFKKDSLKSARQLTEAFRVRLSGLLVDAENEENETLADKVVHILASSYVKNQNDNLEQDVEFIKKVNRRVNFITKTNPVALNEVIQLVYQVNWRSDQLKVKPDFLDRKYRGGMFIRQLLFSIIGLAIGFPFFIYGLVHNIVPYKLTDRIMPKLTTDPEYYAPIAILIGLVLYPLTYAAFLIGLNQLFDLPTWVKLLYFFTHPLFGLFAYYYHQYYKHIQFKWIYVTQMKTQRFVLDAMISDRNKIRELLGL